MTNNQMSNKYEIGEREPHRIEEYLTLMDEFAEEIDTPFYDPEHVKIMGQAAITADDVVALHLLKDGKAVGLIWGLVMGHPFAPKITILHEMAWFVSKEARNTSWSVRLLKAFEAEGKKRGAVLIVASLILKLGGAKLQKVYEKLGYDLAEMSLIKEV